MSNLLINESPLQVLPSLAVKFGLNEAIVIQQMHYWLNKSTNIQDGEKWVYNSIKCWRDQFPFWSEKTISRIFKKLSDSGIIIKGNYNKSSMDKTLWYRLAYGHPGFNDRTTCPNDTDNLSIPIPETTTETTTKKKKQVSKDTKKALPSFIDPVLFADYKAMRKKKRAHMTDLAEEMTIKKLIGFEEVQEGFANQALKNSILSSWTGVFIPKQEAVFIPKQESPVFRRYQEFLKIYPKSGNFDSKDTRNAYSKAIEVADGENVLIASIEVFAKFMIDSGKEEQFICRPEKWLNEERWLTDWISERKKYFDGIKELDPEYYERAVQGDLL